MTNEINKASIEIMREVKYYNNNLYYQISYKNKHKLANKKMDKLKPFIVIDVTTNKIYTNKEFIEIYPNDTVVETLNRLDSLKYKVFKKIKLKG